MSAGVRHVNLRKARESRARLVPRIGRSMLTDDFEFVWPEVSARLASMLRRRGVKPHDVDEIVQETAAPGGAGRGWGGPRPAKRGPAAVVRGGACLLIGAGAGRGGVNERASIVTPPWRLTSGVASVPPPFPATPPLATGAAAGEGGA